MKSIREKENQIFYMGQQIVPATQLVPKFQSIRRCNNYDVLQSIPCSPEFKIVELILLDHPLCYALTATADVPAVYLQQFWHTVHKVPNTKDTIRFKLDTQEITYTVDMFHDTIKLPIETPDNPFVAPLRIADLMEKYSSIPRRLDEDYHSIKDDTLLVSIYSVGNVLFRGMRIPDAFLTAEIHATHDYKEYETVTPTFTAASPQGKKRKQQAGETSLPRKPLKVTIRQKKQSTPSIPPPGDDRERDKVDEATILSLTLHKTSLAAEAQENIAKVQEKLDEEEIERMVEGGEDEESYASEFADSMINDDVDDSGTRIEPESYKEHSKNVNDDDEEIEKEKKDDEIEREKKDDDVEKMDEVFKEKDNDEVVSGSMEFRNEKMQTPIPTPTRSPRTYLSSNKTISEELTATVSPTTATTPKYSFIPKRKKRSISYKTKILLGKVLDHYNKVVPEMMIAKTNKMIKEEMPRLVNLAVNKDYEVDHVNAQEMISKEFATHGPKMIEELFQKHMQNTTLNLYPTTSSSTAEKSTAYLQQQLYLEMKTKSQDQAADPELWEILMAKFEKGVLVTGYGRVGAGGVGGLGWCGGGVVWCGWGCFGTWDVVSGGLGWWWVEESSIKHRRVSQLDGGCRPAYENGGRAAPQGGVGCGVCYCWGYEFQMGWGVGVGGGREGGGGWRGKGMGCEP
ncbi:hypothetical protein Tco_0283040 [Tanacetum coccineum]